MATAAEKSRLFANSSALEKDEVEIENIENRQESWLLLLLLISAAEPSSPSKVHRAFTAFDMPVYVKVDSSEDYESCHCRSLSPNAMYKVEKATPYGGCGGYEVPLENIQGSAKLSRQYGELSLD